MKKLLLVFTSLLIFGITFAQTSPCDDPKFLDLKKKGVANLSENEMTYYAQKVKECDNYQKNANTNTSAAVAQADNAIAQKHQQEKTYRKNKTKRKISTWFWISVFGAAVYFAYQHDMGNL